MNISVGGTYHYNGSYIASALESCLVEVVAIDFDYEGEPRAIVKPLDLEEQKRIEGFNPLQRVPVSTLADV